MDAKDVRIFCEMAFKDLSYAFADRHVSPSEIGRKLGLDEKTVRVRLRKMEDDGFVKYYQAVPSPALFGLKNLSRYRFEAMNIATKYGVLENIEHAKHIVEAFDYLGSIVSVNIAGASPQEVQGAADGITSRFELGQMNLGDRILKEPLSQPDKLDWQIIRNLRYNAHSPTKDIAHALSITSRMAEYRITKLLDSGALVTRAMINTQKQEGLIFYELEMSVDEARQPAVIRQLADSYGEKLWSVHTSPAGVLLVNLFGFNLGEPEEATMNSLKIDGVKWCSLFILKEIVEPQPPNWIDSLIEQKITPEK